MSNGKQSYALAPDCDVSANGVSMLTADEAPGVDEPGPGPESESEESAAGDEGFDLLYSIDDVPPWYLTILLGLQQYLTMLGGTVIQPFILAGPMCFSASSLALSEIMATSFFVSGIATTIQTFVGVRLPIVQGPSFSYLVPALALLNHNRWQCPAEELYRSDDNPDGLDYDEVWQSRMREIQGAIMVSSCIQILIGFSGAIGFLLKYIGPLTIGPVITLIGLSLYPAASHMASAQWGVAVFVAVAVVIFSQYLSRVHVPVPTCRRTISGVRLHKLQIPVFKLFPVLLAIILAWLLSYALTVTNVLVIEANTTGNPARTDYRSDVLASAEWFRFPYPGQWGVPTVSAAGVIAMATGAMAGMLESLGDYYACAEISGAPPIPRHALNRGIMVEGLACFFSGAMGVGNGMTSFSENIGAIGITKVASRRVVLAGGAIMIILGLCGKIGAVFTSLPESVVGGMFCCTFSMIVGVGVSNLRHVDLRLSRNIFIIGVSIFMGLVIPMWLDSNPDAIDTGVAQLDQVVFTILRTGMFLGGLTGFILDNTIPGTPKQRGLLTWAVKPTVTAGKRMRTGGDHRPVELGSYDIPFITRYIRRFPILSYLPVSPTFDKQTNDEKGGGDESVTVV